MKLTKMAKTAKPKYRFTDLPKNGDKYFLKETVKDLIKAKHWNALAEKEDERAGSYAAYVKYARQLEAGAANKIRMAQVVFCLTNQ